VKKTFFVVAAAIIMLAIVSLAYYNSIPSASSADSTSFQERRLIVTGLVNKPLNYSWAEIVAMPKTTVNATLVCVDAPNVYMSGNWTGIKLRTLLEEAKPATDVIKVGFYAADGYSTDLDIETAMRDDIILAYEINGNPLNDLRLVVPGKWGYKWISQLTVIQLVNYNFLGKWESQGYPDEADVSSGRTPKPNDFVSSLPKSSPTPPPTTSPSPSPPQPPIASPAPSPQPTPTPETQKDLSLPIEAVYAAAASVAIVIVVFGVIVIRKRAK
jgi:DMSO/TMAO reductase YedYZ molybdopterin-dependent catalytic subunit